MQEITHWLKLEAQQLGPGEIVNVDSLPLLEAMNALEVMSKDMDSGKRLRSLKGAFDPYAVHSPEQVCWIMDEMLVNEMSWHQGSTLCQTIFTSLYYHNATLLDALYHPNVVSIALRAYVFAYAKCVDIVYDELTRGVVRDCEDCWLDHHGVALTTDEAVEDDLRMLEDAVEWMWKERERSRSAQQEAEGREGAQEGLAGKDDEVSDEWWLEVIKRLEIRKDFLLLLCRQPPETIGPRPSPLTPSSSAEVYMAFDDVEPCLRQHMPLPRMKQLTQSEAWDRFDALSHDLGRLVRAPTIWNYEEFDYSFRAVSWNSSVSPFIRSLHKSVRLVTLETDDMIGSWLANCTTLPTDVMTRLDAKMAGSNDRRGFLLWRGIVGGALQSTFTAYLANPARQRRDLNHLSQTWSDQAHAAQRLSSYPEFALIIPALNAKQLDCLLDAALLAIRINLLGDDEWWAAWWWVYKLATKRLELELKSNWESVRARVWQAAAASMQLLLVLVPRSKGFISREQFDLRHKLTPRGGLYEISYDLCLHDHKTMVSSASRRDAITSTALQWLARTDKWIALAQETPPLRSVDELAKLRSIVRTNVQAMHAAQEGGGELQWKDGKMKVKSMDGSGDSTGTDGCADSDGQSFRLYSIFATGKG